MTRQVLAAWLLVALLGLDPVAARAQETSDAADQLPRQMLHLPLPIAPSGDEAARTVRLLAHVMVLPDGRDAQLWRLSWWARVAEAHRFRLALDYVGLEGPDQFRWGGGAARLQWSSSLGRVAGRPLAIDLDGNLPHGDEALHPLSAKAPSVTFRTRTDLLGGGRWQFWTGWWARRVSPPSLDVRVVPDDYFRSGTGVDFVLRRATPRGDAELVLQRPLNGLPEATWMHLRADVPVGAELAITVGAMVAMAPASERPIDHGWSLGVAWRPAPGEDRGDEVDRGDTPARADDRTRF